MADDAVVAERGVVTASEQAWDLAARRADVIRGLAAQRVVSLEDAAAAATRLGVSRRQVYVLVGRWRSGEGLVSDLLPGTSSGGRGGGRLPDQVEAVVREVLQTRYLTRQRRPGEIHVPLDRRVALSMGDGSAGDAQRAGVTRTAIYLNDATAKNAREYLFHHPEDDPFSGLMLPGPRTRELPVQRRPSDWPTCPSRYPRTGCRKLNADGNASAAALTASYPCPCRNRSAR